MSTISVLLPPLRECPLQMAAALLGGTIQLLGFLPSRSSAGNNALQPGDLLNSCAGLALIFGPSLLLPLLRPDVFEAWRTPINFAARIASFSLPNRRGRRTLVRVCQVRGARHRLEPRGLWASRAPCPFPAALSGSASCPATQLGQATARSCCSPMNCTFHS